MTFNSIPFLIFYPIVLLGYFFARKLGGKAGKTFSWMFLLAASYFFYMYSQWKLVVLILFTTLVSWLCSLYIERCNHTIQDAGEGEEGLALIKSAKRRKVYCLTITLIASLGVLFVFKYANFLLDSYSSIASWLSGKSVKLDFLDDILLPVGISFYTFQTLSYAIDVYRGDIETEHHFGYYALFVSFFPQLVAGPIERPGNLLPQLKEFPPVTGTDVQKGLRKMGLGFFKKLVVADLISVYVNAIYNNVNTLEVIPALSIVIATVLFAVQIYCDFSGYTDIAIGCARVMGIRLMKNFNFPYTAKTVREFWGRWHISLSTWFRDYIYFPLGGSRCAKWKHLRNVCIVFLISGLWHGAAWHFVIWGALHALYQVIGILTLPLRDKLFTKVGISPKSKWLGVVRTLVTFVLVDFAWLFFRANTTGEMVVLLKALFSPAAWSFSVEQVLSTLGMTSAGMLITALSFALLLLLDRMIGHGDEEDKGEALSHRGVLVLVVWAVVLAWTILMQNDLGSTFIYFQF